jgi:DNA-binding response OmpR family regulator
MSMHILYPRQPVTGAPVAPVRTTKESIVGLPTMADLLTSISAMLRPGQAKNDSKDDGEDDRTQTDKAVQPSARDRRPGGVYRFDGWRLDRLTGRLTDATGANVALTERETALLMIFLDAPGQFLMRARLAEVLPVRGPHDPSIELEILGLRRKLETDPRFPEIILTDREADGVGYVFALDVEGP